MFAPILQRCLPALLLSAGMVLAGSVQAGESAAKSAEGATGASKVEDKSEREPSLRPNLKARAQNAKAERAASAPAKGSSDAAAGRAPASMSDLRDMLDQKIAEVQSKQRAAPVVKVKSRSKVRRDPALRETSFAPGQEGAIPTPADAPKVSSVGAHAGAARSTAIPGHEMHWAYSGDTGPESWGMLKPEFQQCLFGKRQSPIDIRDGIPVQLDAIQFDYHPTGFRVIDNGHTIQANVDPGSSITLQGKRYELVQFHFHRPSEERVNGKQFDMVAHLVHKDAEGKLAVIAVLIEQGNAHPALQLVWNALPLEKGIEQASSVPIDLNQILPEQKQYFTYMGSLTTPPCTEGVLWMVMKHPAQMSREQIGIFARMYPMNARPVQSAQGRMIKDGQ